MPFGEELPSDTDLRKTDYKYASTDDGVRQKFTGYEKDEETGLDFAQARMYNNQHARFTAVDPLLASGKSGNPQTFNRYVYVMNSPLQFTDPSGLQAGKWYQPEEPDGIKEYTYVLNGIAPPSKYELVTQRNRNGDLIGPGVGLGNYVIRFNPDGPYNVTNDTFIPWLLLSDYQYKGYDQIFSDEYASQFVEQPAEGYVRGSEDVSLELFTTILGGGSALRTGGKALMESVSNRALVRAARREADNVLELGLSNSQRPGAATAMRTTDGKIYTGTSQKMGGQGMPGNLRPEVEQKFRPMSNVSTQAGCCGEAQVMTKALNARSPLEGAKIVTVQISTKPLYHGTIMEACQFCSPVLRDFGIVDWGKALMER